eukprot:356133-Chlamydomonas_euryale.AAC.22
MMNTGGPNQRLETTMESVQGGRGTDAPAGAAARRSKERGARLRCLFGAQPSHVDPRSIAHTICQNDMGVDPGRACGCSPRHTRTLGESQRRVLAKSSRPPRSLADGRASHAKRLRLIRAAAAMVAARRRAGGLARGRPRTRR